MHRENSKSLIPADPTNRYIYAWDDSGDFWTRLDTATGLYAILTGDGWLQGKSVGAASKSLLTADLIAEINNWDAFGPTSGYGTATANNSQYAYLNGNRVLPHGVSNLLYSSDGIAWATVTFAATGGLSGACVHKGRGYISTTTGSVLVSDDFITFELLATAKGGSSSPGIASDGVNLYVTGGTGEMDYSTDDGVTWNAAAVDAPGPVYYTAASPHGLLASGNAGTCWFTTDLGATAWDVISATADWGFTFDGEKFLAMQDGDIRVIAADGSSSSTLAGAVGSGFSARVIYADGLYGAIEQAGALLLSRNGVTWIEETSLPGTPRLVAVGGGIASAFLTSGAPLYNDFKA